MNKDNQKVGAKSSNKLLSMNNQPSQSQIQDTAREYYKYK